MSQATHPIVGRYPVEVAPFHTDFMRRLKAGVLGNHLLNCTHYHALPRGFDRKEFEGRMQLWVLSRFVMEIEQMPLEYEQVTVETWVDSIFRFFTNRNYAVIDAQGRPVAYARSVWATVDAQERKPTDLMKIHGEAIAPYLCPGRPCPIERATAHRFAAQEPCGGWVPRYDDIDSNGHVNSMKYIDHLLNLFPLDYHRTHPVHRIEVAYKSEAYANEELSIYRHRQADDDYLLEVRNAQDSTICTARITFKNSTENNS